MKTAKQLFDENSFKEGDFYQTRFDGMMTYEQFKGVLQEHDKEIYFIIKSIEKQLISLHEGKPNDIASHLSGRLYETRFILDFLGRVLSLSEVSPPEPLSTTMETPGCEKRIVKDKEI